MLVSRVAACAARTGKYKTNTQVHRSSFAHLPPESHAHPPRKHNVANPRAHNSSIMGAVYPNSATYSGFYDKGYLFPASRNVTSPQIQVKGDLEELQVKFVMPNETGRILHPMKTPLKVPVTVQKIFVAGPELKAEEGDLGKLTRNAKKKKKDKDKGSKGHSEHHDHHHHHVTHSDDDSDCDYGSKGHKGHHHHHKGHGHKGHKGASHKHYKKYVFPMLVGLITAKTIILPLILKALALMAAKGLLLGLVATIMASILSLRKMMEPTYRIEGKKDDVTKIEVVPVPIPDHHKEHHYVPEEEDNSYNPYRGYY